MKIASPSARSSTAITPVQRIPPIQKSKPGLKPWCGPIPKIMRKTVTLSDFIPDDWTLVTRKKNKGRRPPAPPRPEPATGRSSVIRADRITRLMSLLGADGLDIVGHDTGPSTVAKIDVFQSVDCGPGLAGLEAQAKPVEAFVHVIASDRELPHARSSPCRGVILARVRRRGRVGFPSSVRDRVRRGSRQPDLAETTASGAMPPKLPPPAAKNVATPGASAGAAELPAPVLARAAPGARPPRGAVTPAPRGPAPPPIRAPTQTAAGGGEPGLCLGRQLLREDRYLRLLPVRGHHRCRFPGPR